MSMSTERAVGTAPAPSEASEAARREGSRKNALWISARVAGGAASASFASVSKNSAPT